MAQVPTLEQVAAQIRARLNRIDEWVKRLRWLLLLCIIGLILLMMLAIIMLSAPDMASGTAVIQQVVTKVVTLTPTEALTLTPSATHVITVTPSFTRVPTTFSPLVSGIIPAATVQGSGHPFPVTITGQNFVNGVTAKLDRSISITVTSNTTTTIIGVLSSEVPTGVYSLTVTNPDSQSVTLSPVFIVKEPVESGLKSPVLVLFGSDAE
jgi:hypothetical protein